MTDITQQQIGNIALLVKEYDEAIEFYTQKLKFTLVENIDLGNGNKLDLMQLNGITK